MESIFLQPGEGERITGDDELGVTLLADVKPIAITEVRSKPGMGSSQLHFHAEHADCFFVLEGELTIRLEDRELQAGPDTWVYVPPDVVHGFAPTGDGRTHFLNLHVPSCDFGDYVRGLYSAGSEEELRAVRAAFDQQPAPEYGGADPGSVLVRTRATAETVEVSGNRISFRAEAEETNGALGAIEFMAPLAFAAPPPHVHRELLDVVLCLDGTLEVTLGDETHTAGSGAFALAPPGLAHTFSNPSDDPLRLLNLYVPGGFERFFRERAAVSDPKAAIEITSRYDWTRA